MTVTPTPHTGHIPQHFLITRPTPLTDAGVPAAPGLGTEYTGEEDTQLAVEQCHIPASEYLQGGEVKMEE